MKVIAVMLGLMLAASTLAAEVAFREPALQTPSTIDLEALQVIDFDSDGDQDVLAIGRWPTGSGLLLYQSNNGVLNWSAPARMINVQGRVTRLLPGRDVTGDGRIDLVGIVEQGTFSFLTSWPNPGNIGFSFSSGFELPTGYRDAIVTDITGDEVPDAVVLTPQQVIVRAGLRDGGYAAEVRSNVTTNARDFLPTALAAGDFNGDGNADVVIASSEAPTQNGSTRGDVTILAGSRSGALSRFASSNIAASPIAAASMRSARGQVAIVTSHARGIVSTALFTTSGLISASGTHHMNSSSDLRLFAVDDANLDGQPDVWLRSPDAVLVIPGAKDFPSGDDPVEVRIGGLVLTATAADVNGDRRPDLIFVIRVGSVGRVAVYLNTSTVPEPPRRRAIRK